VTVSQQTGAGPAVGEVVGEGPSVAGHPGEEKIAFVLGGGGIHGAAEVGMIRALLEHGVQPDLVLGTSIGALNGAILASDPDTALERLCELWTNVDANNPFEASLLEQASTFARTRTHLHGNHRLRRLILKALPVRTFEELAVPFQCVAANIERASARWFESGPLVEALLASTAVPGLLPPVEVDGEHHLDGGLVDSIPVGRAEALGATVIHVLQVGRVEQPLVAPTKPWEVGVVAFEIARRHRFVEEMAAVGEHIEVHLLPTGDPIDPADASQLKYRDTSNVTPRIQAAYEASSAYLAEHVPVAV
jgi:NTE family protein